MSADNQKFIPSVSMPTPIYHITHVNNLSSILKSGGLIACNQRCPWTLVKEIGVINDNIKLKVEKILQNQKHQPSVKIYSQWYY